MGEAEVAAELRELVDALRSKLDEIERLATVLAEQEGDRG